MYFFFVSLEMMENGGLPRSRDDYAGLKRHRWKFSSEIPLSTYYLNNNNNSESKYANRVREMIVRFQPYVMSSSAGYLFLMAVRSKLSFILGFFYSFFFFAPEQIAGLQLQRTFIY